MDAFEQLVAEIFVRKGYWTQTSFKVNLTKDEKVRIGRHSSPRWEIDVIAYSGAKNELLAVECKSFLDSRGVALAEFQEGHSSTRYKLFREDLTRETVLNRLKQDLIKEGFISDDCSISFGLVAGNIKRGDTDPLRNHFDKRGWTLWEPDWLREQLTALANTGYSNDISAVVAKLLLRGT